MEEGEREGKRAKVGALIQKATNSTLAEVDPRLLKAIKTLVRYSDSELRLAARTLLDLMERDHSQIRFLSLLIIDQLFMRSKLFRNRIVEEMDTLLTLSVGFRRTHLLPPPAAVAAQLRAKAIEFLEKWNDSFGAHYRKIRLGFDYLKNTLGLRFPDLQANAARVRREREERERKSREILLGKYEGLKRDLASIKGEVESAVREVGECLEIVRGGKEEMDLGPFDDEDFVEFRCAELRQIRQCALEEGEKVRENGENKVIFDTLRELYKLVVKKHLVAIQEWISVLIRVDVTENSCRDSILKEVIDMKNDLQSARKECEEAGFSLRSARNVEEEEEEEDFWEEVIIQRSENVSAANHGEREKQPAIVSASGGVKKKHRGLSVKKSAKKVKLVSEDRRGHSNPQRGKLLAEAPVVDWGSHLDDWGKKRDVLANQRGLDLEGHWGRVDYDAVIPAEKIAELNVQATVYKEQPAEIQPCRAPMKKGGLCVRRDLRVCPFHGPIVPRDDEGKPIGEIGQTLPEVYKDLAGKTEINTKSSSLVQKDRKAEKHISENQGPRNDSKASCSGANLVDQLARQAVKNVRERDKEEAKKAQMDKRALKRAKRSMVREHNESVLREAALASTSRSAHVGENTQVNDVATRNKKNGLASMLRNKITAKDRISKRLSNGGRSSETLVIQLSLGEDTNYRDAFPNQW